MGVIPTTYKSWDDPPSSGVSKNPIISTSVLDQNIFFDAEQPMGFSESLKVTVFFQSFDEANLRSRVVCDVFFPLKMRKVISGFFSGPDVLICPLHD